MHNVVVACEVKVVLLAAMLDFFLCILVYSLFCRPTQPHFS